MKRTYLVPLIALCVALMLTCSGCSDKKTSDDVKTVDNDASATPAPAPAAISQNMPDAAANETATPSHKGLTTSEPVSSDTSRGQAFLFSGNLTKLTDTKTKISVNVTNIGKKEKYDFINLEVSSGDDISSVTKKGTTLETNEGQEISFTVNEMDFSKKNFLRMAIMKKEEGQNITLKESQAPLINPEEPNEKQALVFKDV